MGKTERYRWGVGVRRRSDLCRRFARGGVRRFRCESRISWPPRWSVIRILASAQTDLTKACPIPVAVIPATARQLGQGDHGPEHRSVKSHRNEPAWDNPPDQRSPHPITDWTPSNRKCGNIGHTRRLPAAEINGQWEFGTMSGLGMRDALSNRRRTLRVRCPRVAHGSHPRANRSVRRARPHSFDPSRHDR